MPPGFGPGFRDITGQFQSFRGGGPRITPTRVIPRPRRTSLIPPRPTERAAIMEIGNGRPNDERGFIHKKLLGGISKVAGIAGSLGIPGATTVSRITGAVFRPSARALVPRSETARPSAFSDAEKNAGREAKFGIVPFGGGGGPCDFPMVRDSAGRCRTPTSGALGGEQFGVGEAVMGQYGAALEPGSMIVDRAVCLRGMQLGNDGLCYNKSQITNKQRMWPAGRKPLLSGGDMRAISTAARAGRRLEGATKRLQRMGMMKKPAVRRGGGGSHARLLEAHVTK